MRTVGVQAARRLATIATFALAAMAPGCSRKPAAPASAALPGSAESAAASQSDTATIAHGTRKQKNLDIPVFVDGKQMSVLRFGELPSSIAPIDTPSDTLHDVRYYRLTDYLKAIGVDVAHVQRVDFDGNRDRIAAIEGTELRAEKDRFVFDFLGRTAGAPKQAWDTTGLKTGLRIDEIYGVNVFVKTKPWAIDKVLHCYREEDDCKPVVRWTSDDLMKGTRVYVDGKLVSYVKRRLLADEAVVAKNTDGDTTFSTDKYLTSLGIDASKAKRIELLSGDSVVASADATAWVADRAALTFALQRHTHGKVLAKIPANLQKSQENAVDRDVQVTAIEVFNKVEPRSMPVVAVDDLPNSGGIQDSSDALAAAEGGHERDHQD